MEKDNENSPEVSVQKVVAIEFEQDKRKAELEKFKRELESMGEMIHNIAKLHYMQYTAYIEAGFSPAQALEIITKSR